MHLLTPQAGGVDDGAEPVDLRQDPADIVVLSAADTEIAGLARARTALAAGPSLRLANLLHLTHPLSVDLYVERTISRSRLIVLRLIGGSGYWRYGVDEVVRVARGEGLKLAVLSGTQDFDPDLVPLSTIPEAEQRLLFAYLSEGGPENFRNALLQMGRLLGEETCPEPPRRLPKAGLWPRAVPHEEPEDDRPAAALVFYRVLVQSDDLAPVEALAAALDERGLRPVPIFVSSLKDSEAAAFVESVLDETRPAIVLNATAFAVSAGAGGTPLDRCGAPVLQVAFAGVEEGAWRASPRGLGPRDLAMHVALPEIDGRIFVRAVSFKGASRFDAETQTAIVAHRPLPDRIAFAADLAAAWARLGRIPPERRRIALVLANAPGSDARIGHAVGLDAPESAVELLRAMAQAGYDVRDIPENGDALIARLNRGPSAEGAAGRNVIETFPADRYRKCVDSLPSILRENHEMFSFGEVSDSFFLCEQDSFAIPALRFGNVAVAIQPPRGTGENRAAQHDPIQPPPPGLIATYLWMRESFAADAIVHLGKHGVLEWLPGKALALSSECWPEILLGPVPNLYPFIVNDPGEGAQAKRRSAAVIIDHLIPPIRRAESWGPLKDLEALADEYADAVGLDPRRAPLLADRIFEQARALGLDRELGLPEERDEALQRLDAFLCDLKDLPLRDGLHVFGRRPQDEALTHLLLALVRAPRGEGRGGDASLLRTLADDFALGFDPLTADPAAPWTGPRPASLKAISDAPWRLTSDTRERLELHALALLEGRAAPAEGSETASVLRFVAEHLRPALADSADQEIRNILRALDGRFVPPGPSGAPTRGRLDVLPTGRNFFSVDSRALPTKTAWDQGRRTAEETVTAYVQEHGTWPTRVALSAWGTSAMRTGGDDIAQALALIGARPVWESFSGRVVGFEILTLSELKRPRIDVVLRASGFFRDAFPTQMDLLASAFATIAGRDEPETHNPLRAAPDVPRIFSSAPGAYGTGLRDLIESGAWNARDDLARAFTAASGFAYGAGAEGVPAAEALLRLLGETQAVIQAQDAREFDLLDSNDFFEFEGGLAAAVEAASGAQPTVYHVDTSSPERPRARRLEEEIALIVRGRAANPRWIAGVKRHGHRGAGELVQTVASLFAFAAVTGRVPPSAFDTLHAAYIEDEDTRRFLEEKNPAALRDIAAKFAEAIDRGLWAPRRNSLRTDLDAFIRGKSHP